MIASGLAFGGMLPAAAIASALACLAWIRFAASRQLVDIPGGRRVHTQATPRGGGIGIALVMIATFGFIATRSAEAAPWLGACIATTLLAAMGLFDDLRPMRALAKFAAQLVAVSVLLWPLGLAHAGAAWWAWAIVLSAVILWVNIWNFMDGSHGLVGVQALLLALAVLLVPGQTPALRLAALALAGACLGFLPFNLPQARLFLGDVGSHALAAAVIGLLLLSVYSRTLSIPEVSMLSSVLWVDALITLARRTLAGRTLWRPHREHLYQFAVRCGVAAWRVCVAYAVLTTLAVVLVFASHDRPMTDQWLLAAGWFALLAVMHTVLRRRLLARPRRVRA